MIIIHRHFLFLCFTMLLLITPQMVAQSDIEVVPPGDSRSRIQVAGQGRIALHDAKDHRRKMLAD
jgi:hypothetical protein